MHKKLFPVLAFIFSLGFGIYAQEEVATPVTEVKPAEDADSAEAAKPVESEKAGEEIKETPKFQPGKTDVKKETSSSVRSALKKIGCAILMYLPNRLLDATDIFSVDIGIGPEFGVEARATRWLQTGGMYGDKYFLAKGYARQYGGGYSSGWNYEFLCWTSERRFVDDAFGSVNDYIIKRKPLSFASDDDDYTFDYEFEKSTRDFWEIGAKAGWLVSIGAAVHPIDIIDIVSGVFLVDLRGDDYGPSFYSVGKK